MDNPMEAKLMNPGYTRAKWRMLIATVFCYMFYYTGRQTFGFAIPSLEAEFGFSKTVLGYFGTTLLWAYAVGQFINGNLGDKFGGRVMVSLGAILSCGFNWIVSFGTGFFSLFVPWLGNGLAQSMGWAPGSRVLSNWFGTKERGIAFGFFTMAGGMSSIIAFVTSLIIVQELSLGWRWIFRIPVLLLLVGGVAYYILVRNKPEDLGFEKPDDALQKNPDNQEEIGESSIGRYKTVLKNGKFLASSLGLGFLSAARYALIIWVPVYFIGSEWKEGENSWISIALPTGMAFGALAGGWFSDKVFHSVRWRHICLFTAVGALMSLLMYFIPRGSFWGLFTLFLCGFFVYGSQSSFWALCPDLLGNERSGTGVGIMDFVAYLFAGIAAPLCGWIFGVFRICDPVSGLFIDNTALVFPFVAVSCLLSAGTIFFVKR
jgi:OPA family glycerol-3-phosphate transporter-like MFS transporter